MKAAYCPYLVPSDLVKIAVNNTTLQTLDLRGIVEVDDETLATVTHLSSWELYDWYNDYLH